jgi:hypothetical protein
MRVRALSIAVLVVVVALGVVIEVWPRQHRAAVLIGAAEGQTVASWEAGNRAIGPLQTQRIFYPGALPKVYPASSCAALQRVTANRVTCVISYRDGDLATNNVASFVGSIPPNAKVWLIFFHEPERYHFTGPSSDAVNFVAQFIRNVTAIRAAAGCTDCHVKVAMAANAYQYQPDPPADRGTGCGFIPPDRDVDSYLVDVYEQRPQGEPLNRGPSAARWDDWLRCVQAANAADPTSAKPIGIAEYGLADTASDEVRAATIRADAAYLHATFPTLSLWEYWDVRYEQWTLQGYPLATAAWQKSEHR